ncbi:hypothetical protein B0H11DRAFT_1948992, partial [Mycena galericulata]
MLVSRMLDSVRMAADLEMSRGHERDVEMEGEMKWIRGRGAERRSVVWCGEKGTRRGMKSRVCSHGVDRNGAGGVNHSGWESHPCPKAHFTESARMLTTFVAGTRGPPGRGARRGTLRGFSAFGVPLSDHSRCCATADLRNRGSAGSWGSHALLIPVLLVCYSIFFRAYPEFPFWEFGVVAAICVFPCLCRDVGALGRHTLPFLLPAYTFKVGP